MKIFLSHSHAQRGVADALAIALRQDGHEVFLDADELKAADGYHKAIREQIGACDLFLFLVSPQALEAGRYALTELGIARERWPDPSGHVLPVLAAAVPFEDIPPYLKAVTLLQPKGDLVAETVARVATLHGRKRGRSGRWAIGLAAVVSIAGAAWLALRPAPAPALCLLEAVLAAEPVAVGVLEAGPADALRSFVVVGGQASLDIGPLTDPAAGWIMQAKSPAGRVLATFQVQGCPGGATELNDESTGLRIQLSARPAPGA